MGAAVSYFAVLALGFMLGCGWCAWVTNNDKRDTFFDQNGEG